MINLTEEQKEIIDFEGNLCIDAVSGSSKTTSLIEYAKARPKNSFIYLCFNKSVKQDAERRFPKNVKVVNMHSLAYREMGVWNRQLSNDFGPFDVADIFNLEKEIGEEDYLKVAFHIFQRFHFYTCSDVREIENFDYHEISGDSDVVQMFSGEIEKYSNLLWGQMMDDKVPITHNVYLKQYQLSEPALDFDYVMLDECQDSFACIADIFVNQRGKKIAVGDRSQAIYRFLNAVDAIPSLLRGGFSELSLTNSFRFRQDIADLANQVLGLKELLVNNPKYKKLAGVGNCRDTQSHAILSRSNMGVFKSGVDALTQNPFTKLHFEGDINSYIFTNEGSIYDVYNLMVGKPGSAKYPNKLYNRFGNFANLLEYIEETGDGNLSNMAEVVQKHGPNIFTLIKKLKENNVEKDKADIVLSTCHRAKGQEYDVVELTQGFITENDIKSGKYKDRKEQAMEEINILYVALTRAKNKLYFPESILPNNEILQSSKLTNPTVVNNNFQSPPKKNKQKPKRGSSKRKYKKKNRW